MYVYICRVSAAPIRTVYMMDSTIEWAASGSRVGMQWERRLDVVVRGPTVRVLDHDGARQGRRGGIDLLMAGALLQFLVDTQKRQNEPERRRTTAVRGAWSGPIAEEATVGGINHHQQRGRCTNV